MDDQSNRQPSVRNRNERHSGWCSHQGRRTTRPDHRHRMPLGTPSWRPGNCCPMASHDARGGNGGRGRRGPGLNAFRRSQAALSRSLLPFFFCTCSMRSHGHPCSRRGRRRHWRFDRRRDPRRQRRHHRRLHRLQHRLGGRQLDHLVAGAHAAHRGRAARHAAHHLGHRRRGDPAAPWPDAAGRQHHLGDRFPRGDEDHHAGRRKGRRGRQGQDHRVSLLRQLRRRALRGTDHRHRPHMGRRQSDGPDGRHLALVSGRRGADRRSRSSPRR